MRFHPAFISLGLSSAPGGIAASSSKFTVSRSTVVKHGCDVPVLRRCLHTTVLPNVTMNSPSSRPEYDKERDKDQGGIDAENQVLNTELQAKVNELFGGRQNVKIDLNTDVTQAQFTLRDPSLSHSSSVADRFRSPKYILTFIAVVSLVTGTFFTTLYMTGYVHGLDPSDDSHYEMPTYGKDSYIEPYQLLQQDYIDQIPTQPQQEQQQQQQQ